MARICLLSCLCSTTSGALCIMLITGRVVAKLLHTRLLMVQPSGLVTVALFIGHIFKLKN